MNCPYCNKPMIPELRVVDEIASPIMGFACNDCNKFITDINEKDVEVFLHLPLFKRLMEL